MWTNKPRDLQPTDRELQFAEENKRYLEEKRKQLQALSSNKEISIKNKKRRFFSSSCFWIILIILGLLGYFFGDKQKMFDNLFNQVEIKEKIKNELNITVENAESLYLETEGRVEQTIEKVQKTQEVIEKGQEIYEQTQEKIDNLK